MTAREKTLAWTQAGALGSALSSPSRGPVFRGSRGNLDAAQEPPRLRQLRADGVRCRRTGGPFIRNASFGCEELSRQVRELRVGPGELFLGDLLRRHPELLAPADELADSLVCLPERHAPDGEEVREFRREREPAGGRR